MKDTTNEFSFVLKPAQHGIGVFAAHGIKSGTYLRLFGTETTDTDMSVLRNKNDVPEYFRQYCLDRGDKLMGPADFGAMPVGWYMNHSKTPNAVHRNLDWYAMRDIEEGEEITADYNSLDEPEEAKEEYYK